MPNTTTNYLTPAQAAAHLDVSESTIFRWIRRKELVAYKIGKHVRIDPRDLQDWVERNRGDRFWERVRVREWKGARK